MPGFPALAAPAVNRQPGCKREVQVHPCQIRRTRKTKGANGASNPPAAGKKPARIPLPFTILILLLVSGIVLFAILFALQFFYTRNLGNSLPSSVTGTQKESSANTGGDDGAPSIL
ncbi:MAG: hypothetical protein M9908_04330 [Phyllobacteriaceae bacterium]|nr:hypothetical protein [Phyllobacteriaceae bacterium]